ncbi:MAG: ADP-forming succinate--CoA ligase subunit beta [Polyangiaceae bacterium]|nr:ADP-forming succinate--CoA ligase subunit beta [Polyangiaceae bacterium]
MKIHEYQAKQLIVQRGLDVPRGIPAFSVDEAERAATELIGLTGSETVVVKAQIHAGGRGKGGGVRVVQGAAAARDAAGRILGVPLVTHQTGPCGQVVRRLLIEQGMDIARELYVGLLLDRAARRVVVLASPEGGMDIEELAVRAPDRIFKEHVDPALGLASFQARKLAFALDLQADSMRHGVTFLQKLYQVFTELDASLVEINPLVVTREGRVVALDCKMVLDDNALFRHKDIEPMRDLDEEDATEIEAKKYDLSFIKLEGNIGCMVNGAGLAMATMDIIKHFGGQPANFLDVGGSASLEKVTAAFKIITSDPAVQSIFINIFGGIMKCDVIASGVVAAVRETGLRVPLVVRLEGTNVEIGARIIAESGLPVTTASDMADGAQKAVALAGGARS